MVYKKKIKLKFLFLCWMLWTLGHNDGSTKTTNLRSFLHSLTRGRHKSFTLFIAFNFGSSHLTSYFPTRIRWYTNFFPYLVTSNNNSNKINLNDVTMYNGRCRQLCMRAHMRCIYVHRNRFKCRLVDNKPFVCGMWYLNRTVRTQNFALLFSAQFQLVKFLFLSLYYLKVKCNAGRLNDMCQSQSQSHKKKKKN